MVVCVQVVGEDSQDVLSVTYQLRICFYGVRFAHMEGTIHVCAIGTTRCKSVQLDADTIASPFKQLFNKPLRIVFLFNFDYKF